MSGTFSEWTERLRVYNEFINALGQYKLNVAEAEKRLAEARNQHALAEAKETIVRQLQRDLRGLNRVENTINRKIASYERHEARVKQFLRGRRISTGLYSSAHAAYKVFEGEALLENADALFDVGVPNTARRPSNFIDIRSTSSSIETVPDDVENGLQYMDWLRGRESRSRRYITRTGTAGQRVVIKMLAAINGVAKTQVEKMRTMLSEMRAETYEAWQPVAILGVPVVSAAKKVESAGTQED